ncbi:helix-turn-helix domain-containing protein [Mesorhizobium sp. M8A.F.Ca.ET.173.01.1.1]|nr:helix-turn-helix domain-containing protein [Mesorhizobium sp. M8A.F.Ca.ET.173.01.1.1]
MSIQWNLTAKRKLLESRVPTVAIVACDGFGAFQFSAPCVVFGSSLQGLFLFETRVCAVEGRTLRNEFGMLIETPHGIDALVDADVIVIPFWRSPGERPPEDLLEALREAHMRHALIVGLCLGGYVLAYSGLLDHRRASTHWDLTEDFTKRFPKVMLNPEALYVEDNNLVTSAGMGAGIDCCLNIVRSIHGSKIANQVAQQLVIPFYREGKNAQFVQMPVPDSPDVARIQNTLAYVAENLRDDHKHDVNSLAARACMSRRSFTRHFNKVTGMSLGKWVLSRRLQKAQLLLESTSNRIEDVAYMVGFPSAVSFRQHFRSEFGTTPKEWRQARFPGLLDQNPSAMQLGKQPVTGIA